MPVNHQQRASLIQSLMDAGRASSTAAVLYHQVLAQRFGLTATDWKCADIIDRHGSMTAGELAAHTYLTSGAITGVLNHLEKARIIRRKFDPQDRRKTLIELRPDREQEIMATMAPFIQAFFELAEQFSDEELQVIHRWITQAVEVTQHSARTLRENTPTAASD